MKFECYSDWHQLPASADVLFTKAAQDSLFFSRFWFENLVANSLNKDEVMQLACVLEGDEVLAILPLMKRDSARWHALSNIYASLYTVLITDDNQENILHCLAQGLWQLPLRSIRLNPVDENDEHLNTLQKVMEVSGFECHRSYLFFNWFYRVDGQSFKEYMDARPSRVRNTIARKQRKLEREHRLDIQLYTDGDLQQAVADYNKIYHASWKANELFENFIEGLVVTMAKPGWLRLAILYIDEKPAAAQLWFVVHGKASIFRLAYDQHWKKYSPGTILTGYLMKHVIDIDKVEEIDFLYGNDAYKQDWMSERRKRWALECIAKREPKGKVERTVEFVRGIFNH